MFKATNDRDLDARDLAASAQIFPEKVQRGLDSVFAGHLREGESAPDFRFAQELVRRVLEATSGSLRQADGSHTQELVSHAGLRRRRDESADRLRGLLRKIRFFFDRALAPGVVREVLPVRRLSNMKPSLLVAFAGHATTALRNPALGWENQQDDYGFAAPASMADTIDAEADQLAEILGLLAQQSQATQSRRGAKHADLEAAADVTRRCKQFLEGLYRLAGLDFHADRIVPARRKKSRQGG